MPSTLDREKETPSPNHSDSDDWTLVSPPESGANSSPVLLNLLEQENTNQLAQTVAVTSSSSAAATAAIKSNKRRNRAHKDGGENDRKQANEEQLLRASGSQDADDEEDDGLVEIDLNVEDEIKSSSSSGSNNAKSSGERNSSLRLRKITKNVEFAPIVVHQQQTIAKTRDCSTNTTQAQLLIDSNSNKTTTRSSDSSSPTSSTTQNTNLVEKSNQTLDESNDQRQVDTLPVALTILHGTLIVLMIASSILAYELQSLFLANKQKLRNNVYKTFSSLNNESEQFDWDPLSYTHPMDTANLQLLLLDRDLDACINKTGYGWIESDGKLTHPREANLKIGKNNLHKKFKPFRGMVCYEREEEWRKRFKKLKDEYNIDLKKMILQSYKRIASDLLGKLNPSVRFNLIINQLDYLDYLDEHRRREQFERLKAENYELRSRLMNSKNNSNNKATTNNSKNQYKMYKHADWRGTPELKMMPPSMLTSSNNNDSHDYKRSLAKLENENGRLRGEVDTLKASLVEKAGTVYIRQSLELEKCERENTKLREFHQQVAHEVSSRLKQLDLHTIDAAALLNDHESLSSQLALTRGYLLRLGEEVSNLVIKNKNIERESQFYRSLLNTLTSTSATAATTTASSTPIPDDEQIDDDKHIVRNQPRYYLQPRYDHSNGNNGQVEPVEKTVSLKLLQKHFPDLPLSTMQVEKDQRNIEIDEPKLNENKSTLINNEDEEQESFIADLSSNKNGRNLESHPVESSEAPEAQVADSVQAAQKPSWRGDWLSHRAKLREQLRKSSGIDMLEKQIDRLIDQSKHYLYKPRKQSADRKQHHYNNHHHNHDKESIHNHYHKKHSHKQYKNYNSDNNQYNRYNNEVPPKKKIYTSSTASSSNKGYQQNHYQKNINRANNQGQGGEKLVLLKQLEAEIANFRYDL